MAYTIVFMGTPAFALPTLTSIQAAGHRLAAVYSQPPRPAGRGQDERPGPVHAFAEKIGVPVFTPTSLKGTEAAAQLIALKPDVIVVVAYGMLLPPSILAIPEKSCLNLHASLLPRWRGAAPIQRAIMAGDRQTAVQVMRMEAGLDTGPVGLAQTFDIAENETAGELHDRLAKAGGGLMLRALEAMAAGTLVFTPQSSEGVTYAAKIRKSEAAIDFARPASEVHNRIRALSPFPGAWFEALNPVTRQVERIKVLGSRLALSENHGEPGQVLASDGRGPCIACARGTGSVELTRLQRASRRPMDGRAFLQGFPMPPGSHIGR